MSAVTLAEVKAHLQMASSANDTELQRFINAAEAAITRHVGPLVPLTVTSERRNGGRDKIRLRYPRAVSLTSITYSDGTPTTVGDFDLDKDTGVVYFGPDPGTFTYGVRNVLVSYVAGFAAIPDDLAHAVKELVRHLWKTQRPNSAGARPGFEDEDPVVGAFSSWPVRVQEWIEPFEPQQFAL